MPTLELKEPESEPTEKDKAYRSTEPTAPQMIEKTDQLKQVTAKVQMERKITTDVVQCRVTKEERRGR